MNALDLEDRSDVESKIVAALRNAIDAHGIITKENASSAAKRVYGQMKNLARQQRESRMKRKHRRKLGR
jgi:hypothetical protein